jgi:transcription initiation factor TFIIE subunit beta
MDLSQRLDKFKLQQERCQASLSVIAATRTPASATPKPQQQYAAPRPAPARPSAPAPAVRFSDDTARLQKMHQVRKSAVGSQIKAVIELLYRVIHLTS